VAGNGNIKLSTLYAPSPLLYNLKRKPFEKGNEYIKANHISINNAHSNCNERCNSIGSNTNSNT
tara:strand:+ start:246 stop:437 length:192 start_codon:yes stop_codon:yes gene_type:complete